MLARTLVGKLMRPHASLQRRGPLLGLALVLLVLRGVAAFSLLPRAPTTGWGPRAGSLGVYGPGLGPAGRPTAGDGMGQENIAMQAVRRLLFPAESGGSSPRASSDPEPEDPWIMVPAPDHYDCDNGSATATYEGDWTINKGGSGVFYFSHNDTGDTGISQVSINDQTIPYIGRTSTDDTAKAYLVPENASEMIRNVSVSALLYDGVYFTDGYMALSGRGLYYPSVGRGVAYLTYAYGFVRPKVELNQTFLEPYLLNTSDTWPPSLDPEAEELFTGFTPDAEYNLAHDMISLRDCVFMLYFETRREAREIASHTYPPDTQTSLLAESSGQVNATHEWVPAMDVRLIGNTSLVDFSLAIPIVNRGRETKQALYYSAAMLVGCTAMLVVGVYTYATTSSPLRLEFISMTSVMLQLFYDILVSVQSVNTIMGGGIGSNCLFLVTLAYAAFCFSVDFSYAFKKYEQRQLRLQRRVSPVRMLCMSLIVYVGFFLAIVIQQYVPYKARFFIDMALFSFWLAQGIFTLVQRKQRYGFTYLFVILTTVVRLFPMLYFFCYPGNFLRWEAESWYAYLALGWGGAQLLFLLLVMLTARRAFNVAAKGHADFYQYVGQPLSTVILDEVDAGMLYAPDPEALWRAGATAPAVPAPPGAGPPALAPPRFSEEVSPPLGSSPLVSGTPSGQLPASSVAAEPMAAPVASLPAEAWERVLGEAIAGGYDCLLPYKAYEGYGPLHKREVGRRLPGGPVEFDELGGAAGVPLDRSDFSDAPDELAAPEAAGAAGAPGARLPGSRTAMPAVAISASAPVSAGPAQHAKSTDVPGGAPGDAGAQTVCLNPLHQHSPLYSPDLTPARLFRGLKSLALTPSRRHLPLAARSPLSSLAATHVLCFTLVPARALEELASCTICLDGITLRPENLLLVGPSAPAARAQELAALQKGWSTTGPGDPKGQKGPQLWMTPCGHCFHDSCLARWTEENLQCPVDRKPIPVPTESPV